MGCVACDLLPTYLSASLLRGIGYGVRGEEGENGAGKKSEGKKGNKRLTLLRKRFEAIMATSSQVRLLTSKSRVRRG